MRWTKAPAPEIGDERVRRWFAWQPVAINGETRWLERVVVRQEYRAHKKVCLFVGIMWTRDWCNRSFVDDGEA